MLEVRDLSVSYGAVGALESVSLTVGPSTIVAVLGANGAGKTTLLRAISGLVRARAGSIVFDGRDVSSVAPEELVRLGLSHVPEGRGIVQELTVEENLQLGGLWRRDRAGQRRAREEVYELFPAIAQRRRALGHSLSGGERQMLAIGRALVARPALLLLDEPSLGLAPFVVTHIMTTLRRLRDEQGIGVLLVEQNARSALSIADRAVVLSLGRVAISEAPEVLQRDETLRHAYLGF